MRRSVLKWLAPVMVLCVFIACGRGGSPEAGGTPDADHAGDTPAATVAPASDGTSTAADAPEVRKPLYDYDPDLLKHPENSLNLATEFLVEAELSGTPRTTVKSIVAVESANVETWKDMEKNKKFLRQPVIDAFSGKDPDFVRSPEGKLKVKEEVVLNLRASPILTHKAIKNAYILQLLINITP